MNNQVDINHVIKLITDISYYHSMVEEKYKTCKNKELAYESVEVLIFDLIGKKRFSSYDSYRTSFYGYRRRRVLKRIKI